MNNHEVMKTYMTVSEETARTPLLQETHHHRAANDGVLSRQWDQRVYNVHVGNSIFVSRHVAQVSNMPDIEKAEGLGLISI